MERDNGWWTGCGGPEWAAHAHTCIPMLLNPPNPTHPNPTNATGGHGAAERRYGWQPLLLIQESWGGGGGGGGRDHMCIYR